MVAVGHVMIESPHRGGDGSTNKVGEPKLKRNKRIKEYVKAVEVAA